MSERLFGLETEYSLALIDSGGRRIEQQLALNWLMEAASRDLPHLHGIHSQGLFLRNGARFYVDCGGHPEMTTPECPNPWDAARYLRAGDQIMADLARGLVKERRPVIEACVFRNNVDYSGLHTTWGSHESYLHRANTSLFRRHLIPHLVSRLIFTGAGGFNSLSDGIEFTLSPRVPHLRAEVSGNSTDARGILHTKDESLSTDGNHRLHLLCSESLFSERALFLRVGTTALIVALIEAGKLPGEGLKLPQALGAMTAFAFDPSCTTRLGNGTDRPCTAIGIQRHYLRLARENLGHPLMPPWAEQVCDHWAEMLCRLEHGPSAVAGQLDWALKYQVFSRFIKSRGYDWETIGHWNAWLAQTPRQALSRYLQPLGRRPGWLRSRGRPEETTGELFGEHVGGPELSPVLKRKGCTLEDLPKFVALREELFEIDTRFGQIGETGLVARLGRDAPLDFHLDGVDNIEHAMEHPPAIGRATLRGQFVRQHGGDRAGRRDFLADWTAIHDRRNRRILNLSDPFAHKEEWREMHQGDDSVADVLAAMRARLQRPRNG